MESSGGRFGVDSPVLPCHTAASGPDSHPPEPQLQTQKQSQIRQAPTADSGTADFPPPNPPHPQLTGNLLVSLTTHGAAYCPSLHFTGAIPTHRTSCLFCHSRFRPLLLQPLHCRLPFFRGAKAVRSSRPVEAFTAVCGHLDHLIKGSAGTIQGGAQAPW